MPAQAGPLLDEIRRDAAASVEARISAAHADAARIQAEARDQAALGRTVALAERERALAGALESARAETTQRVSRETLTARAAALDRIFAAAAARLPTLSADPRLREVLGHAITDALSYLPDGPVTVRCPSSVAASVRGALAESGRDPVTVQVDDHVGLGAIVESGDGAVAVDVTLAKRLERERRRLAIAIIRKLEATAT